MLEDEKQQIVYRAIQDVNKTYREQQITEKDPLLYFKRVKNWLSLFYAFDVTEGELTKIFHNIQKARKKSKEETQENQGVKENSLEGKEKENATHHSSNDSDNNNSN